MEIKLNIRKKRKTIWMRHRIPLMRTWNCFFSIIACVRVIPHIVEQIKCKNTSFIFALLLLLFDGLNDCKHSKRIIATLMFSYILIRNLSLRLYVIVFFFLSILVKREPMNTILPCKVDEHLWAKNIFIHFFVVRFCSTFIPLIFTQTVFLFSSFTH